MNEYLHGDKNPMKRRVLKDLCFSESTLCDAMDRIFTHGQKGIRWCCECAFIRTAVSCCEGMILRVGIA